MARYRKKPVEIEAVRNDGTWRPVFEWLGDLHADEWPDVSRNDDGTLNIQTLEGTMRADVGDYLICGVQGELYPCKPDIFEATYEAVEAVEGLDRSSSSAG